VSNRGHSVDGEEGCDAVGLVHCSRGVRGARLKIDSLPLSLLQGIGDFMHAIDGDRYFANAVQPAF
jgi:hypothetical protein